MADLSQHAEWQSLIDTTGPFLAVGVLEQAFPQGLDKVATGVRQRIRSAYEEWREAVDEGDPQLELLHKEWLKLVLEELLEYDDSILKSDGLLPAGLAYVEPLSGTKITPDFVVMAGDKPRMLIATYPADTNLENPLDNERWSASPIERMVSLCRATGLEVGLVTDGECWAVVGAPKDETSSAATWYARIWQQEPITLQAFQSLVGVRRCFGAKEETLDSILRNSLEHQSEVTDTLGEQVRRAVEVLVQALDRADEDRNRELLKDISEPQLYEAGLTVMMRLVVILCAEERGLLLLGEPIYDQHYAVTTLRAKLREDAERLGLEVLDRRHDAWARLLAIFRGVFGGIEHETLRQPPLGGSLFDPDRFPFLEGRELGSSWKEIPAVPLPIDNRTVLLLLSALQVLEHKRGAQLLSYQALDVEQIGHVYEGLLERTVSRVTEFTLGLQGTAKFINPNVSLDELEIKLKESAEALVAFVKEQTGRNVKSLLSKKVSSDQLQGLQQACGGNTELVERVTPFIHLIRTDSWGDLLVYHKGSFVVTLGAGRRETGTHYTPKSLTEPIVKHTLEPLVYSGPAEGKPPDQWKLKTPDEILDHKVCDMAMGSAAFLVQACRWLAGRLVEAWVEKEAAGNVIGIEGNVMEQAEGFETMPNDRSERLLLARRLIASRCLYGVDINPMAVELAKLSIWLVTMLKNRPFNFLDHALKCGDSLLGVSSVEQIENFSLRPGDRQVTFGTANLFRYVDEASAKRHALEELPSNDHIQIETKNRLYAEAEAATARVKAVADCLIEFELRGLDGDAYEDLRAEEAEKVQFLMKRDADASLKSQTLTITSLSAHAHEQLHGRRLFHWPIEFPEVFAHGGFDSFVGNPPFIGGRRIRETLGGEYRKALYRLYPESSGNADLCAFFFLRAFQNLKNGGTLGLVATNTIAQGDTKETGLEKILSKNGTIFRSINNMPWPGVAAVVVSVVCLIKKNVAPPFFLNDHSVDYISSALDTRESIGPPETLAANKSISFQGSLLRGMGFVISQAEAEELLGKDSRNVEVVQPFLNGDDLNRSFDQTASRWAINFFDWPLKKAQSYKAPIQILMDQVYPKRMGDKKGRRIYEKMWWKYWRPRTELYSTISGFQRVLVVAATSKTLAFAFSPIDVIFSHATYVFAFDEYGSFAVMQSATHEAWAREYAGSLKGDLRYTSDVFETFPRLEDPSIAESAGKCYYEFRQQIMQTRQEGLTKTYNRFHNRREQSSNIGQLRALRVEMDQTVAIAYGWSDLDLGHGFHATKQGIRYTISEPARREVLDRLLALNHQRYEEEVKAGLHKKKTKKPTGEKRNRGISLNIQEDLDF